MKKGYTLVELLIVIVIIGILTTIAFVGFGKIQADARDKERHSNATILAEALEKYYDKNGEYPSVPAVTNTNVAQVKTTLGIVDADVLVMPKSAPNTTTSLTSTPNPTTVDKLAYDAESVNQSESTQCKQGTSADPLKGGCDEFTLRWLKEDGNQDEINSRHSGRDVASVLLPPTDPTMTASISGGNVVGTVTHSVMPACAIGTVQYKIITSTASISNLDWSTVSWQSTDTKSIGSPVSGTQYFFYAIARCYSGATGEAINQNVATDSLFFTTTIMTASWSGTSAVGTISSSTSPMCGAGLTEKFFIEYKIDTVAAAGTWTTALNWVTAATRSYTIANANLNNPRTYSFRGQFRCDNGATAGTPSGMSNTDFVISAPAAAALSNTSTTTDTTWTWPSVACPVGTTVAYKGVWTGDYNAYPAMASVISSGVSLTTTSQGFTYGLKATASCGTPSAKILSSTSNDSTYYRGIPAMNFRTARAGMRTYRPSSQGSGWNGVYARLDTIEPNSGVSDSQAKCATNLKRVVGWATSKNSATWSPNSTPTSILTANIKDEREWVPGTSQNFYYASDLDSGDQLEVRFAVRCKNTVTGKYAAPYNDISSSHGVTSNNYMYDDRIGNLILTDGQGEYHILCDPRDSTNESLKYPLWCSGGNTDADDATGTCTLNSDGSSSKCMSHRVNLYAWTWSWSGGFPPSTSPNQRPSSSSWGLTP